jgi:hypothetical protein
LIEYVDGTTQCEDCGQALQPGAPPAPLTIDLAVEKDAKLVPARIFMGGMAQMDAEVARSILQSQGIPSVLQGETSAEVLPVLDVPLYVRAEDAARAERILQDYLDTEQPSLPEEDDSENSPEAAGDGGPEAGGKP